MLPVRICCSLWSACGSPDAQFAQVIFAVLLGLGCGFDGGSRNRCDLDWWQGVASISGDSDPASADLVRPLDVGVGPWWLVISISLEFRMELHCALSVTLIVAGIERLIGDMRGCSIDRGRVTIPGR